MKEIEIQVSGMHCSGCENRVKNAVSDIKGVKEVKANHETGKVNVMLKKDCNEEILKEIKQAVERMDFKVEG